MTKRSTAKPKPTTPPSSTVTLRYRQPSPDEALSRQATDPDSLPATLDRLLAAINHDDKKAANLLARRVRWCLRSVDEWDLPELLTPGQFAALAIVTARRGQAFGNGRPRPSTLPPVRRAIRDLLAKDITMPSRTVAQRVAGSIVLDGAPGILGGREGAVRYRDHDGKVHDMGRGALANLVSKERRALRPGR